MNFQGVISELRRRNVFRVATAYAIAGWLIIQICTSTFPYLNLPEWLITAVIIFVLIGFPLSVIFAWAFELTPEGLKKSKEVEITQSVTDRTGKKLNGIIITVLSMGVIFLLVERVFFAEAAFIENQSDLADTQMASIAVLPFVNMSGDEENEYFSDGLSEELLNALAKVEGMKVAGRTSSFKFKGQNENLSLIGEELKVGHILEGSVRKSGDRVRITAQLIKVNDGYHVWSETYDRELTVENIFGIQEEISRKVLSELKVRLLPEADRDLAEVPTTDIEAYNIYLKGTQYEATRITEDLELAIKQYKEAVRLDPSFAKAYARMAIAYELYSLYGNIPDAERRSSVRENVDQALFLDDDIPEAYAALGLMYQSSGEYQKGIDALKKAIELNPNYGIAYTWLGNVHAYNGDPASKIIENYLKGYAIDPLDNVVNSNYARSLMLEDKPDEALLIFEARAKLEPKYLFSYYRIAEIQAFRYGDFSKAFEAMLQAKKIDPDAPLNYSQTAILAANTGLIDYAKELRSWLNLNSPDNSTLDVVNELIWYFDRDLESLSSYVRNKYMKALGQENFKTLLFQLVYLLENETGNLELTREIINTYFPEFQENVFEIKDPNLPFYVIQARLAKKDGNVEQLKLITEAVCEYAEQKLDKLDSNPRSDDYIYPMLHCADLRKDKEDFLKWLANYDEKISPLLKFYDLIENTPVWEFAKQDIPEINEIKQETRDHYLKEYAETVSILKENGKWDDSWNEVPVINGVNK